MDQSTVSEKSGTVTVNGVIFQVRDEGFSPDCYDAPYAEALITAPNGDRDTALWFFEGDAGVYNYDGFYYDSSSPNHQAVVDFICEHSGCSEEEAIDAMSELVDLLDMSTKYSDNELYKAFRDGDVYLKTLWSVSDYDAYIIENGEGYIGGIKWRDKLKGLVTMTAAQVLELDERLEGLRRGDACHSVTVLDAVQEAMNLQWGLL